SSDTFAISRSYSAFNEDYHKPAFCQNIKKIASGNTNDCPAASTAAADGSTLPDKIRRSDWKRERTRCR
ncbi:MAG: hypothetical protein ABN490_04430, partial [Pantoea agglomerans]